MIGEILADRYRITERLVAGELLSTYQAFDMAFRVEVEVDVLTAHISDCVVPSPRLEEILDAAMLVRGAHVSLMHGWGEEEERGFFYIVRERTDGATLAEVLCGTGELPAQQVVEVVRAVVEVLAEAYGEELFYLGLNPHQVLLDGRGGVRLFRVGFAWILEEMEPALAARVSPYRAPETDGGKEGTRTSDVYALAVMVREMLPHGEDSGRLESLLQMATDPLPKRRPSSPRLLLEELEGATGGGGDEPPADGSAGPEAEAGRKGGLGFLGRAEDSSIISLSRRSYRRTLRNLLLIIAGGLLVWLIFAAVAGLLGGKTPEAPPSPQAMEEWVTLPDLQGLTAAEAEEIVEGLGLRCTSREAPSRLWSAGRVAAQEPAEGAALLPGGTVCLVISTGRSETDAGDAAGVQDTAEPVPCEPVQEAVPEPAPAAALPPSSPASSAAGNLPPCAVPALTPGGGSAPLYVAMDGSGSYDPDGRIVRYVWYCGDGIVLEGACAQHVYDPAVIPARFQVVLEVFDSHGSSDSSEIVVEVY